MNEQIIEATITAVESTTGKSGPFLRIRTKEAGGFSWFQNINGDKATAEAHAKHYTETSPKLKPWTKWKLHYVPNQNFKNVNKAEFVGDAPNEQSSFDNRNRRDNMARTMYACGKIAATLLAAELSREGSVSMKGALANKTREVYQEMETLIDEQMKGGAPQ